MTRTPADSDARHRLAAVLAHGDLDDLVRADVLGVAIHLDDTSPPPPPLGQVAPSVDVVVDLVLAAEDLDRRTRTGTVADRLHAAEALRELHAAIGRLPKS
jgi:hypothetical protein